MAVKYKFHMQCNLIE